MFTTSDLQVCEHLPEFFNLYVHGEAGPELLNGYLGTPELRKSIKKVDVFHLPIK